MSGIMLNRQTEVIRKGQPRVPRRNREHSKNKLVNIR